MDRRSLLQGMGAWGLRSSLPSMALLANSQAQAQSSDYRALVCVYLFGGNDAYNMVVPYESSRHAQYLTFRPQYNAGAGTGLGVARGNLLTLPEASGAINYGLNPSLPRMKAYWTQKRLAVMRNMGTLVEPLTRSTLNDRVRPQSIASHVDQQEISMAASRAPSDALAASGWGARSLAQLTDYIQTAAAPEMGMVSFSGVNRWQQSTLLQRLSLSPNTQLALIQQNAMADLIAQGKAAARPFTKAYARILDSTYRNAAAVNTVVANTSTTAEASFKAASSGNVSGLYGQLMAVSKFIQSRAQLGSPGRQIFFVSLGGFDTHSSQYPVQASLYGTLDGALYAFFESLKAQGMDSKVTAFTMSDFGRTLRMNANNGTDHAWASHSLVLGGAVNGGLYGEDADWSDFSEDLYSVSSNTVLPKVSIDQCGATLARWLGVSESHIPTVFPNVANFSTSNLGFMSA